MHTTTFQKVLHFWFKQCTPQQWFSKDKQFDLLIKQQFEKITQAAARGECALWRNSMAGRVAEIVVLDQFSRNIWRDTPKAFQQDGIALVLAQEVITCPSFRSLPTDYKKFALMPFMHSESRLIHEQALELFTFHTDKSTLDYEIKHKYIIDRFGRYPHRNAILQRTSTQDELIFLSQPNSSF